MEKTAHELELDRREEDRQHRKDVHQARNELMRLALPGYALDREHVATMLAQGWGSNKPFLLARHFVLVGLVASGWSPAEVARALNMREDEVMPEHEREIWMHATAETLAAWPDTWRAAFGERSRSFEQWGH